MATSSPTSHGPTPDLSILKHFRTLKDPRRAHRRLHRLQDLIVIALCAVIAGAQDWQEIETFGRKRLRWLKRCLPLPHGGPCQELKKPGVTVPFAKTTPGFSFLEMSLAGRR
jgi:hypothetical protein